MLLDKFIKPIQGIIDKMVGDAEYELHGQLKYLAKEDSNLHPSNYYYVALFS